MTQFFNRLVDYFALQRPDTKRKLNDQARNRSISPVLGRVIKLVNWINVLIVVALFFFCSINKPFVILSLALTICAYFSSGIVLGFIFGIPKKYQNKTSSVQVDANGQPVPSIDPTYTDNTSLEEISDWITKIIIGLSLTQFNNILEMMGESASNIRTSLESGLQLGANRPDFYAFSYSLIVFYSVTGGIIGYLWTRIEFAHILAQKDRDLREAEIKRNKIVDDTVKALNERIENVEHDFQPVAEVSTHYFKEILSRTPPGPVKDDIQKNRWGGASSSGNYKLSATVTRSDIPSFYNVKVIVSTVDGTPITGLVGILLHDSFEPVLRVLDPKGSTEVYVEVISYEAFTVAALCQVESVSKYVALELDLNSVTGFPRGFYWI